MDEFESESGQIIQEFTIISEDDKIQEISPRVFLMSGLLMEQFQVLQ